MSRHHLAKELEGKYSRRGQCIQMAKAGPSPCVRGNERGFCGGVEQVKEGILVFSKPTTCGAVRKEERRSPLGEPGVPPAKAGTLLLL